MLSLVEDNSKVKSVVYTRVGLDDTENRLILQDFSDDRLLRVTADYKACVDSVEDIEEALRPSLKTDMVGPFSLMIYNFGDRLATSMLAFELLPPQKILPNDKIIIEDPGEMTSRAIAVLPFVDVFQSQINREFHRSEKLIK